MARWSDFLEQNGAEAPGVQAAVPRGVAQQTNTEGPAAWASFLNTYDRGPRGVDGMTGGQWGSTENGWNTPFYEKMFKQRDERAKAGTLHNWYDDANYTGIATYDYKGERNVKFGDIYQDGSKVGNIFDPNSGYDEQTAYATLAQLTLDKKEQAQAFEALRDDKTAVKKVVEARREQTTKEVAAWNSQQKFQSEVDDQKDEWGDAANFGAVASGAAGGAIAGSRFGLIGAAAGAVVGGIGGWLNRDSVIEQAARATVQTEMAAEKYGAAGALATGLRSWAGVGMGALSPGQNLVQGITDAVEGEGGDGRSEYYEMEDRPWWLTGLNVGATFGDSILQFGSGIGKIATMGAMGGSVVGGAAQLTSQGGATFDDRRGDFHAPEDAGQWASAVGAVGTDVLGFFGARGIYKAAENRNVIGGELLDSNGQVIMQKGAETVAGRTFTFKGDGTVDSVRDSITLLSPAEAVQWGSVKIQAANMAARKGGAITDDEYHQMLYRASVDLMEGTNLSKTALVNAFGEGTQEGMITALEALSHGWTPELGEIYESYLMGAAGGAGFSVGARRGVVANDTRAMARANLNRQLMDQPVYTKETWAELTPEQKRAESVLPPAIDAGMKETAERVAAQELRTAVMFQAGLERSIDATLTLRDKELRTANPALEGTRTISSLQSAELPSHIVQTSGHDVLEMLQANLDAVTLRLAQVSETDPEYAQLEAQRQAGIALVQRLRPEIDRYEQGKDAARHRVNKVLRDAWNQGDTPLSRMAAAIVSRDPNNSDGSFQLLLPQIGEDLRGPSSRGLLQVSQAILKAIDGDYDGDKMRQRVLFDGTAFRSMRLGLNLMGTSDGKPVIGERATEAEQIRQISVADYANTADNGNALAALKDIQTGLQSMLGTVPNASAMIDSLITDIRNGNTDAKVNFLQRLYLEQGDAVIELGERGNHMLPPLSNVIFAVDQVIVSRLQRYTESTAARRTKDDTVNQDKATAVTPDAGVHAEVAAKQAATIGQTMQQATAGTDPFRAPQKLHYSVYRSPVLDATRSGDLEFNELVRFYEQLSSGARMSAREDIFAYDEPTRLAMRRLIDMARQANRDAPSGPMRTAFFLAAAKVPYFKFDDAGNPTAASGMISAAQAALRESVRELKARDRNLLDSDPALAAKYDSLERMDAGQAIAEIFDAVPAIALIGEAANNYAANLTFGQIKADYLNLSPERRDAYRKRAKSDARYSRFKHQIPYELNLTEQYEVSDYKVFTDALFAAADTEIALDRKTGALTGRLAERSKMHQDQLVDALDNARRGLKSLAKTYGVKLTRGKNQLDVANIARLLDREPRFARAVTAMLPDDVAAVVFDAQPDGKVMIPNWFFEMLTLPPKQGAMLMFRHTLIAQVKAHNALENPKEPDDRFVELVLTLREDPPALLRFDKLLFEATDVDSFIRDVNRTFATGAPYLPWHRDAAQFDSARTKGGWAKQLPGAEWRNAMRDFAGAAKALNSFAELEADQDSRDRRVVAEIKAEGPGGARFKLLQQRLDQAGEMLQGMGPQAMKIAALAAALGFFGGATDKGKAPDLYAHLANAAARGDGFSQETGYEQLLGAMTAFDADDASQNMPAFAREDVRLMDGEGRPVTWERLDAAKFLDMWDTAELRPMLRAIAFPTTFEVQADGSMSQQMLAGTSIESLLNNETYKKAWRGETHNDKLQAASIIDALARKYGGDNPIQRMVADLVIARTTRAGRQLGAEALERMRDEAYDEVVRAVTAAAAVGPAKAREEAAKSLEKLHRESIMKTDPDIDEGLQSDIFAIMEDALLGDLPTDATAEQIREQKRRLEAWNLIKNNDAFERAVQRFTFNWKDPKAVAEKKQELYRLIQEHPSYAESSGSVPELALLRSTTVFDADGVPVIAVPGTDADQKAWEAVTRAVAGVWMDDVTSVSSTRVQSTAMAKEFSRALLHELDGKLNREGLGRAKYWDTSWRYLVDDLLRGDSPVMLAAQELHSIVNGGSRNTSRTATTGDLRSALNRILDPERLGPWTSDVARQSVDAQNRMDSSGAGRQVARPGISYAKIAAISAATRRTFADPAAAGVKARSYRLDEQTTGLLLSGGDVTAAGVLPDGEPLAFLNGRFAETVTLHFETPAGPGSVDLLRGSLVKAGYSHPGAGNVPYKGTDLARIRAAAASALPADATRVGLEIAVFHPADAPSAPEYANNVYFEGTFGDGIGDNYDSLIGALWMSNEGLNKTLQAAALKANKKGTLALVNPKTPKLGDVRALENVADLYGTLRAKTLELMNTDHGYGKLPATFYNAVFKDLKTRHVVRGVENGAPVVYTADQVIAMQQADPNRDWSAFEIVALSPRAVRSLYGEQDVWGLRRPITEVPSTDSTNVRPYRNTLQDRLDAVPGLLDFDAESGQFREGRWQDTRMARRSPMSQSVVLPATDPARIGAYKARMQVWNGRREQPDISRLNHLARLRENSSRALAMVRDDAAALSLLPQTALRAVGINVDMGGVVDPLADAELNKLVFEKLKETLAVNEKATAWVYSHILDKKGDRPGGVLHGLDTLNWRSDKESQAFNVLHGDVVVIRLDTFPEDPEQALAELSQVMAKLADLGATVALVNNKGRELRHEAGRELESRGYERVAGSGNLWAPADPERRPQTYEARMSRLTEVREQRIRNLAVVFQDKVARVEENAALVNNRKEKDYREVSLARDLSPVTGWSGYNIARTDDQLRKVKEHLEDLANNPAKVDHLFKLSEAVEQDDETRTYSDKARKEKRRELGEAIAKAAENLNETDGRPAVGTEFGPGDILVLIGPGDQVILYRHGYEPPRLDQLKAMQSQPWPGEQTPAGVAIYGTDQMSTATTHTGKILEWSPLNSYGLGLIEAVPLQALGNKTVLERNGMKLIGVDIAGSGVELPGFGPMEGWEVDYIIHRADSLSKENFDGVIDTAQNAIGYLGMDFVPAMAKTLFGENWPTDEAEQRDLRGRVSEVLEAVRLQERVPVSKIAELLAFSMDDLSALDAVLAPVFATNDVKDSGARKVDDVSTAEAQVTVAALLYMLAPTAQRDHVMSAGGVNGGMIGPNPTTLMMPELFTRVFDRAPIGSPLRTWFFGELNKRLNADPSTPDQGYVLRQDWTFVIKNADPSKNMEGWLQFAEAHSSGDNPTLLNQARDRRDAQQVSRQQSLVGEEALGMRMFQKKALKKTARQIERTGIQDIREGKDLFKLMNGGPVQRAGYRRSRQLSPAEQNELWVDREAHNEFQPAGDTGDWAEKEKTDWDAARERIAIWLGGVAEDRGRVDSWVRLILQRPKAANPETEAQQGKFSFAEAAHAIKQIEKNLREGKFPTSDTALPVMNFNDVDWIYRNVQQGKTDWRLNTGKGTEATWTEHIHAAIGGLQQAAAIEPAWLHVINGYLHTFREAGSDYVSLPISIDEAHNLKLLDLETNQLLISVDPNQAEMLASRGVMDVYNATVEDLYGGNLSGGKYKGYYPEANAVTKATKRMGRWRATNNIPNPVFTDMAQIMERGGRFVTNGTTSNATMRVLMNIRLTTTMLDPMLRLAAPVDMFTRHIMEDAVQFLTGDNIRTGYGKEVGQHARDTVHAMARNTAARGMIYEEIVTNPQLANAGRIERWTNAMARFAGRWQDPTYGLPPTKVMERYVSAAMRYIVEQGTATTVTPNMLLTMLDTDPTALKTKHPIIHQYAINAAANAVMLKPTTASLFVGKGLIDPLSNNPRWIINTAAHLGLKIPYTFHSFFFNIATNTLGLQGLDAMLAAVMTKDPRKQGGTLMGRWRALLMGEGGQYDPTKHDIDWAGETLEAVNLSTAFIKSGLTHTSLMGLGLLAGSLGLTGEDEEDRYRRRAAEMQGAGYVYDPRDPANDFRNADAIFFDNLPSIFDGLKEMFEVQGDENAPGGKTSMANLHWTLKQFLSPIMGIERYLHTGNFLHVVWGFEDALGSMPLVNASGWDDANRMAAELHEAAQDSAASGTPEALAESFGFMMNAVWSLERMLLENAFVNTIYQTMDKYDRDPYKLVDLDASGRITRDDTGVPMPADIVQEFLLDETAEFGEPGTVGEKSPSRGWFNTQARILGESRATLGLLGMVFTGFNPQDSLWRYNMAVKERKVDKNPLSVDEGMDLVLSLWDPDNEREVLTELGGQAIVEGLRMGTLRKDDPALENAFLTMDQRHAIRDRMLDQLMQDAINMGLDQEAAENHVNQIWHGSRTNPWAVPLKNVVYGYGDWEGVIPYSPTTRYRQLNTTYVTGPDGRPVATGIGRDKLNNFFGLAPLQRFNIGDGSNLGVDGRLNSVDDVRNLNTGMRSLERMDESWANPTAEDILAAIEEGIDDILKEIRTPSSDDGYGGYGNRGGYSRGGGGYSRSSGGGSGYTYRLNSPNRNDPTYSRSDPYLRMDNPNIRRASIRRERFSSERGRLNQWQ